MDELTNQFNAQLINNMQPREKEEEPGEQQDLVDRDPAPPADPSVEKLVKNLIATIKADEEYWEKNAFKKMREWQKLASGHQWPVFNQDQLADAATDRYVANIILRHIRSRTASLYGKNPKAISRRRERLLATVWDGRAQSLQEAVMSVQQGIATTGMPDPAAMAVIMDAQAVLESYRKLDRIAKTLELLFKHQLDEQVVPFKTQMKAMIRRALTTGVGYAKLGYQRVMDKTPETHMKMNDISSRLAVVERLSADIADGQVQPDAAQAEELRLLLKSLSEKDEIIVREGLLVTYPDSTAIIPCRNMTQLRGFVGADHVSERFYLSREKIQEIYKVDVGTKGKAYLPRGTAMGEYTPADGRNANPGEARYAVYECYDKPTGMVYVVCDGYPNFLREPEPPEIYLERFYPWFAYVVNEVYDEDRVFPPSDVELIKDMQLELNRARQSLREHRRAARPRTVARKGVLSEADKDNIANCVANAVIELESLQPNENVEQVLQPWSGPRLDPNLYETGSVFEDILRVTGGQEANFGGTSSATATESSIAEGSRMSTVTSEIDDLDEFLNEFARAAGQILLLETDPITVRRVVGPGAMWPDLTREDVAQEIYLEVEAASTGRPNKAQEVQNAQALMPLLLQIPGLSPEWIARELIRRMDDRLDLTDAFSAGMPSIQALNRMGQMTGAPPQSDPNNQGGEGGGNAPGTKPEQVNAAPRSPVMNAA